MVIRKVANYNFNNINLKLIVNGNFLKNKFYISLPVLPQSFDKEKTLLSIPGSLDLRIINRSYNDGSEDNLSIHREGCFYFNEEKEWILEALCHMQTSDLNLKQTFIVRLPLSAPFVKGTRIGMYFDGTWIRFMKGGEVLNQNSGLDEFCPPAGELYVDEILKDTFVGEASDVDISYREIESKTSADFFFPYGWNTSIGDVMTFSHNGVYHLIYLLDRRHHGSGPCGSHYICQMTSENLVDWYEQTPICEITNPWASCGTGTMFFHNGKYYMSYGLHTERYRNAKPKIEAVFNEEKGEFEHITFKDVFEKGGLPAGGTYSVSDDGINFTPSKILVHSARNPSGYVNENGGITLYCGYCGDGVYESPDMQTPFKRSDIDFSFAFNSPMRNTTECPAFFDWNGYKYLIIGFSGYFRTIENGSDRFVDAAALGENIYEGLSVPMVAEFGQNRRIMAGWVKSPLGWGGVLMQRELIQEEKGKLGMKWIPELVPAPKGENLAESVDIEKDGISLEKGESYYFKTDIDSLDAEKVAFSLEDDEKACTVELNFKNKTVQINDAKKNSFAEPIDVMYDAMLKADKDIKIWNRTGVTNVPQNAKNYTLPDICGNIESFEFKMLIRYSKKLRSTVLDAEIAGRRTFISVRDDFFPTKLKLLTKGNPTVGNSVLQIFDFEE